MDDPRSGDTALPRAGHAARRGLIASNPVKRLERGERPSVGRREIRVLARDEIARVIAHAPDNYRTLLATAIFSGLRTGELLGLTHQEWRGRSGSVGVSSRVWCAPVP